MGYFNFFFEEVPSKMNYLLISVPTDKTETKTRQKLENAVDKYSNKVTSFKIPALKVGTLDRLMQLSDELQKLDQLGESVVKKIERSYYEMWDQKTAIEEQKHKKKDKKKTPSKTADLKVGLKVPNVKRGNAPQSVKLLPNDYVQQFQWDRLYDSSKAINQLSDDMNKIILKADDDLKTQMQSYNDFKSQLEIIERKETGTLMVKPLGEYVQEKHMVNSEHLTTIMVVIPKNREEFFLTNYEFLERRANEAKKSSDQSNYVEEEYEEQKVAKSVDPKLESPKEKAERKKREEEEALRRKKEKEERIAKEKRDKLEAMCENVVPKSHKLLHTEADFCLYRIVVFRKGEQRIRRLLRQERFTVRQFKFDRGEIKAAKRRKKILVDKRNKAWEQVRNWCRVYFERIFKMWIHIKALRCFVETILRYGLPPDFQAFLVQIKGRSTDKLRGALRTLYANLGNASLMDEDTSNDTIVTTGMAGLTDEFYPYVSLNLNLAND